jgi:subtilase family serine protease
MLLAYRLNTYMAPQLRRTVLLFLLSLTAVALHGQAPQQIDRVHANPDLSSTTQLTGHLPPWADAAQGVSRDLGPVAPGLQLQHVVLLLSRAPAVEAAFQQLLADQQNPSSPRYHQWLTPEQVGDIYGPTQHDVDAVTAWLTSQGLEVEGVTPSRIFIAFSGDAISIQRAFSTELHNFATSDSRNPIQYSITAEPSVPAALAPVIAGVTGLSQQFHHPFLHRQSAPLAAVIRPNGMVRADAISPNYYLGTGYNWILPADFSTLYDINSVYNSGITGTGESVAIIGASRVTAADIANYESIAGLATKQPVTTLVPGQTDPGATGNGTGGTGDENQGEATLDVDRVLGTAPGATADLLLIDALLDADILSAINYETGTKLDPILTMSFGSCEAQSTKSTATTYNNAFAVGAAEGISMFVSSGDSAVTGCAYAGYTYAQNNGNLTPSTNILCTPNIACVGGTEFNDSPASTYWSTSNSAVDAGGKNGTAMRYIPEGVWNDPVSGSGSSTSYVILGGGGGPSIYWPKPTWQTGTGVPADNVRDTPDISLAASGHNAYVACTAYSGDSCVGTTPYITGFSGTSAAAPGMAAITALLLQKLNKSQGNIDPLLYKLAANYPTAIHDATPTTSGVSACAITTASLCNSSTPGPSGLTGGVQGYLLTTGYDEATGLGSVDVANLLTAAAAATAPATTTNTLTPLTSSITTAHSITFTSTITSTTAGTPTGTVQFAVAGVNNGTPVTLSSAAAQTTISFSTAGTFSVTAVYSGDGNYAASTGTASVTVTAPVLPSTTDTLSGTSGSITTQQTASFTSTITSATAGTPTGTVQFYRSGTTAIGSPVTLSAAKATLSGVSLAAGTYSITASYSGDSNYAPSTSNALSVSVNAVPTATSIAPPSVSLTTLQTQAFTATIANSSSTGTPTGTVQFNVDGVARGSTASFSGLTATSPAFSFTAGSHTVTATYSGDTVFAGSTSTAAAVTVTAAPASIAETVIPTTITTAGTSTVTFTVSGTGTTPTGTIAFHGPTGTSTLTLVNGTVSTTLSGLAAGTYSLYGVYSGDGNYATATSSPATLTVTPLPTPTIAETVNPTAITTAGTSTVTFTVSNSGTTPTGTVAFHGPTGTSTLTLVNGTVSTTLSGLAPGTYSLYGVYSGDSNYTTETSSTTTLTVTPPPNFTLAASPTSLSLAPGAATGNTSTIAFTSQYTFAGSVSPTCLVAYTGSGSATDTPTCGFSTAPVTLVSGGTATTVLSIASTSPSARTGTGFTSNGNGRELGGVAFSALLLLLIPATRRRALRQGRGLALLLLASATLLAASGCGAGGNTSGGGGGASNPGTTAGAYTVTVTGTSGTTTANTTVALTIQ